MSLFLEPPTNGKQINDMYLITLKVKIDSCEYSKGGWPAALCLEMLCDRFAFGLQLKEKLLREKDLDLTLNKGGRYHTATRIVEAADKRNQSQNIHAIGRKKTESSDTLSVAAVGNNTNLKSVQHITRCVTCITSQTILQSCAE